ncbi:hypothetical protein ACFLT3_00615 [Chloroflexota bacterium]
MKRSVFAVVVFLLLVSIIGCTSGESVEVASESVEVVSMMKKVSPDIEQFLFWDIAAIRADDDLEDYYNDFDDFFGGVEEHYNIHFNELNYMAWADGAKLVKGDFDLDEIREGLEDSDYNDWGDYRDVEVWGSENDYIALVSSDLIVFGRYDDVRACIRIIKDGDDSLYDNDYLKDVMGRLPDGIWVGFDKNIFIARLWTSYVNINEYTYNGLEVWGYSYNKKDKDTMTVTVVLKFEEAKDADDAMPDIENNMRDSDERNYKNIHRTDDGEYVIVSAEQDMEDFSGEGDGNGNGVGGDWDAMTSGTTRDLHSIWGSSSTDVFAVGDWGAILHYDGSSWSEMSSGTTEDLWAVWGSSSSDVFAVGESGTILHYDGSAWNLMSGGDLKQLKGIWGSSATDVFAVGTGIILRYDGSAWSTMSSGTTGFLSAVWGSSATDVFAVGKDIILHYNGSVWSAMSSDLTMVLEGIWGSSSSNVFAVGYDNNSDNTILHYDGSAWSTVSSDPNVFPKGIWGSSSSDVFAVGLGNTKLHYDGTAWSAMSGRPVMALYGIWGSSSTDVFAVGLNGTILHYTGQ